MSTQVSVQESTASPDQDAAAVVAPVAQALGPTLSGFSARGMNRLSPAAALALQRAAGNDAVTRTVRNRGAGPPLERAPQRVVARCACGGIAPAGGECMECRKARRAREPAAAPEALRLAVQTRQVSRARLQRQEAEHGTGEVLTGGPILTGIPYEKWAPQIEAEYRKRGDYERASAIRACREKGGASCVRILSVQEVHRLMGAAKEAKGDLDKAEELVYGALPMLKLLPDVPKPPPLLRLVPPLPEGPPPAVGLAPEAIVAAGGIAALVATVVIASYLAWQIGKFEEELRKQGYIIMEDPLAVCIGGCHQPSPSAPMPGPQDFPPIDPDMLKDWFPPRGSQGPGPQPAPGPQQAPRRYPNQTCDDAVLDQLQRDKDRICGQISGTSCSPSKTSPKKLAKTPCSEIRARIKGFQDCLDARQAIQDQCFGGVPDAAHIDQMNQLRSGMAQCVALEAVNCAAGHPMAGL